MVIMGVPGPIPEGWHCMMKGWDWIKGVEAGGKDIHGDKKFGGVPRHQVHHCNIQNGCTQPVLKAKRFRGGGYMAGGAGIDAVSSSQSRQMGIGVEHSGTGLRSGGTGGRGRETMAMGGSDMSMAV
jgi:hypothetical protein